jgi:hypothetical protein
MPPQPALPFGPVDQLTTPTIQDHPACLEYRRTRITRAGAEPVARALAHGIDQPDLQRPRLAGRDQTGDADGAAALAVAATVTPMPAMVKRLPTLIGMLGNPRAAGVFPWVAPPIAATRHPAVARCACIGLHIEAGMDGDGFDILQRRLPVRAIFDDLVLRA